jgi:hypothetical protein
MAVKKMIKEQKKQNGNYRKKLNEKAKEKVLSIF